MNEGKEEGFASPEKALAWLAGPIEGEGRFDVVHRTPRAALRRENRRKRMENENG